MSGYVKINVICSCGKLLKTVTTNSKNENIQNSIIRCPLCKKNVGIQAKGDSTYISYKK